MTVYADTREHSKVIDILKKNIEVVENQLPVGDYLIGEQICIERKTCNDFLQSLIDGRLFSQLKDLKNSFSCPILIIEGETLFQKERKIHPNAIRGALASIAIDYNIPIIWTYNQLETADMIISIANREKKDKETSIRGKRTFLSENQEQEFIVCGLPKVSIVKAKSLLKKFGNPEKVFTAKEEELKDVEGIGEIMAKNIRKILTKRYEKSILD